MLGYVFLSGNWWHSLFQKILLFLDSVVYWAVSMCYQLFVRLATFRLFEDSFFSDFASRIYSILGVFMLFYLAYALLNALIDPEKLTGDKGVSKIASNLVISLILLGLVPTIFDYAYRLQNYILSSDIIGAIILGSSPIDPNSDSNSEIGGDEAMIKFGDSLAFTVLNTFVNPDSYNVKAANNYTWYDFKIEVLEESNYSNLPSFSDAVVGEQVIVGSNEEAAITYYGFISTVTGAFLIYILLSFTLDLGVRVIKLAFCQLIAPIPIIMRVMPSKKSTFDKWVKTTLSVFFEVFTRVALMYIAVYFIQSIWQYDVFKNFEGIIGKLAMVVVILGIFAFAKQAPKMLSDMLGIESGNLKLGIGNKLRASGFLGGAIAGGLATIQGAATGTLGGLSTGLFNKNINTWAAMKQGFSKGFKGGGNQFAKQRKGTFEGYYGYNVDQGLFGKSIGQRLSDANGDAVSRRRVQDARNYINQYERTQDFNDVFYNQLNNGTRYNSIATAIRNAANGYKTIFDEADAAARQFAEQNGISFSSARAQEVRKNYLKNYASATTDQKATRAINSVLEAENMTQLWNEYSRAMTTAGTSYTSYFGMTDTAIRMSGLTDADANAVIEARRKWEMQSKSYTENLANGNYSRKETGQFDDLYDKKYQIAQENVGEKKKEDTNDLLRQLLKK